MELAIDTSNRIAGLALSREGQVVVELTWVAGRNHTREVIPSLLRLLAQTRAQLRDLKGIIVARGPGSFSGVRVGISLAKGLAFALDIPLVGISTLEALAFPYAGLGLPVCPLLKLGRELAMALFQLRGDRLVTLVEEQIIDPAEMSSRITSQVIFCGEMEPELVTLLRQELGEKARFLSSRLRRPGYLCELGWQRLRAGERDDLATLQPVYLKKPSITLRKR